MQHWLLIRTFTAAACSVLLFFPISLGLQGLIATFVQFFCGWQLYRNWKKNLLPLLGITGAYLFSFYLIFTSGSRGIYFETSSCLITLLLLGHLLENRYLGQSINQEQLLRSIRPDMAQVKRDGTLQTIPASEIAIGDIFIVNPNQRIPADGIVEKGESVVDEALLLGGGNSVEKQSGNPLYAGSLNHHSTLIGKATKPGNATLLNHLIELHETSRQTPAPSELLAHKSAAFLVPLILSIALFCWLGSHFAAKGFLNALAVLLIGSPRAFTLGASLPIALAQSRSYAKGIFIKDAKAIEYGRKIDRVIIDKRAIMTDESLSIEKTTVPQSYFPIVKTLCEQSEHPAAKKILAELSSVPTISTMMLFRKAGAEGVCGYFDERKYFLGSVPYFLQNNLPADIFQKPYKEEPGMVVAFGTEKLCIGYFVLSDRIEPSTQEAISSLKELHIQTQLLCSDQKRQAEKTAAALGFDTFISEITPQQQVQFVEMAKREGKIVAMVGENLEALTAADIGFGKIGLSDLVETIHLCKSSYRKINQNLLFASCYHLIAIPLAALGFIHPILAASAMVLSTLLIANNSVREKTVQIKNRLLQFKYERSVD